MAMKYRREIDGLRAIAVVPVILFHAGFSFFSGGFVGVDVFFVISGYLITTIIISGLDAGTFSLMEFYERRARRILPALFFVILACVPFAWLWMAPADLKNFSESAIAASIFVSNVFFWKTSGYFDLSTATKPLLHTWSLAVEEQYYLIAPVFLILTLRFRRSWIVTILALCALLSLALAQWGSGKMPAATFYLLPTRIWELLIGAMAAFYLYANSPLQNRHIAQAASLAGIALIFWPVFSFDHGTPYPSLYALAPTTGTALIILAADGRTLVGRVLGSSMFVYVGLISYSAYLWHQPLFALAWHRTLQSPSLPLSILLIALTFVLAYLTWRFIETPFRDPRRVSRAKFARVATTSAVALIAIGLSGHLGNGFEARFRLPKQLTETFVRTDRAAECFDKPTGSSVWLCPMGSSPPTAPDTFIVFGDSHALSYFDVFDEAARREQVAGLFSGASGCTPLLGIYALRPDQNERDCHALNNRIFEFAKSHGIRRVFLIARWAYYTDGDYNGGSMSFIGLTSSDRPSRERSREAFAKGVRTTAELYAKAGIMLYFLEQAPQQKFNARNVYYRVFSDDPSRFDHDLKRLSITRAEHSALQSFTTSEFQAARRSGSVDTISMDDVFCDQAICPIGTSSTSFYFDDDHPSIDGARRGLKEISALLRGSAAAAR